MIPFWSLLTEEAKTDIIVKIIKGLGKTLFYVLGIIAFVKYIFIG
jgi:hypothetical protein